MSDKNVTMGDCCGGKERQPVKDVDVTIAGCCGGKERQPVKKPCKNKACGSMKKEAVSESEEVGKVWHCGYEATICPCNPCFCGKPIDGPRKMFP